MTNICFISCFFGPLPIYFDYFTASANYNPDVDFFIFSDQVCDLEIKGNVKILPFDLASFNTLASDKLDLKINVSYPFKLCDFKPAYGIIFYDIIKDYEFWAMGDIDLIWGNINRFLTKDILKSYDVIRTREYWTTGSFCLFRNTEVVNNLFKVSPDWQMIFTSDKYFQFDESGRRWDGVHYTFEELKDKGEIVSLFDVVMNYERRGLIKAFYLKGIKELVYHNFNFLFKDGNLIDTSNREEIFYHHFVVIKSLWRFYIPSYRPIPKEFRITPEGIISEKDFSSEFKYMNWKAKRVINVFPKFLKSMRNRVVGYLKII